MNVNNIINVIDKVDSYKISNKYNDNHSKEERNGEEKVNARELDKNDIIKIVDKLNKSMKVSNERVRFSYHEENNQIILRVSDSETGEVIREIPSRNVQKLHDHIQEYIGMLVDESR